MPDICIFPNTCNVTIAKTCLIGLKSAKNWVYTKSSLLFGQVPYDHKIPSTTLTNICIDTKCRSFMSVGLRTIRQ